MNESEKIEASTSVDRYQRHSLIEWFSQERLKRSKIAVVGAGAIGNELIKNLALLGVGEVDIFDLDVIEVHNLTRSVLFRETDIGRSKAKVAAERARNLDPSAAVRGFHGDVWRTLTLTRLQDYHVIVCCVDNFETRLRLNQLCLIAGVDFVNTGIDSRYALVESFPFSADSNSACYECALPASAYQRIAQRYSCGWLKKLSYAERRIPTTIVTSSVTGGLASSIALRLGSHAATRHSERILVDTIAGGATKTMLERRPDCVGCGRLPRRLTIVPARPLVDGHLLDDTSAELLSCEVILSDQIIVGYRCVTCGETEDSTTYVFRRAAEFDETITICSKCGNRSVDIEIRDQFELKELLTKFRGRCVPAKYAIAIGPNLRLCLDLEEGA